MTRRLGPVLAALSLLAFTGCAGPAHPATAPSSEAPAPIPSTTPGVTCLTAAERAGVIRFPSDNGASIAGVVLGKPGPIGFVLAHQSEGDMCDWVPYGRRLAAAGYTVLALDLNGFGASSASPGSPSNAQWDRDVVAGAKQLRQRGVRAVVLMGASLGGTTVVAAAARLSPPPAAVVDLSGPAELSGVNALKAAPQVTAPMLFISAHDDETTAETRQVSQASTHAAVNRLEIVAGANHGITLLDPTQEPLAPRLSELIVNFVRQYAH